MRELMSRLKSIAMRFLCLILFFVATSSCHKTICKEKDEKTNDCPNGVIMYAGNPAADGLGWVIRFESGKIEKPSNLSDNFKIENLNVSVCYEKTNEKFPCMCKDGGIEMIKIVSIQKR